MLKIGPIARGTMAPHFDSARQVDFTVRRSRVFGHDSKNRSSGDLDDRYGIFAPAGG